MMGMRTVKHLLWLVVSVAVIVVSVMVVAGEVDAAPRLRDRCPQWKRTALQVGWSEREWRTLDRIMWRESRCQPRAYNGRGMDDSRGLVQINTKGYLWTGHGGVREVCKLRSKGELMNPRTNLRCAERLHQRYGGKMLWRVKF